MLNESIKEGLIIEGRVRMAHAIKDLLLEQGFEESAAYLERNLEELDEEV